MATREIKPLLAIIGETASGKTKTAIQLALEFNGEIVNADSRILYKGMDIGTAKPTLLEQRQVPHHLIDITTPDKPLNVANYKKLALAAIKDVQSRGKLPILVGGSGLYVDAVLFDFDFGPSADETLRSELNKMSIEDLQNRILVMGLEMPVNAQNKRHLVRAIETAGEPSIKQKLIRANTLVVGLETDSKTRVERIETRVNSMLRNGLEKEVRKLARLYSWDTEPMRTIGYQEFKPYLDNQQTLDQVKQNIISATNQYAKRQRTWFRRNKAVHWVDQQREIVELVTTLLNKSMS